MSKIILLDYAVKNGTYSKGPNQGKEFSIAVAKFAGVSGRIVNRIIPNVDVAKAFKGQMIGGQLSEATVAPYSFKNAAGETINTDKKWVVQFDGESLNSSIRAHGKKPALATNVVMQASADVTV